MKKLLCVLLLCFSTGCYTMKTVAPIDTEVQTLSETEAATFKKSVKVWYALWGLVPISKNSSAEVVEEYNLKSVRVETKIKFVDFVIGAFTGIASIVPATMTVEGNQ